MQKLRPQPVWGLYHPYLKDQLYWVQNILNIVQSTRYITCFSQVSPEPRYI